MNSFNCNVTNSNPHARPCPMHSTLCAANPILINIWAVCKGRLENKRMQRLANGIENEKQAKRGNEKNKEKALDTIVKLIRHQKQPTNNMASLNINSRTPQTKADCSAIVIYKKDSIKRSLSQLKAYNQELSAAQPPNQTRQPHQNPSQTASAMFKRLIDRPKEWGLKWIL